MQLNWLICYYVHITTLLLPQHAINTERHFSIYLEQHLIVIMKFRCLHNNSLYLGPTSAHCI